MVLDIGRKREDTRKYVRKKITSLRDRRRK